MQRAHILLAPGIREGWGLTITEANASGTPTIGYNIVGHKDSIKHGQTGLLTDARPDAMARAAFGPPSRSQRTNTAVRGRSKMEQTILVGQDRFQVHDNHRENGAMRLVSDYRLCGPKDPMPSHVVLNSGGGSI